MQIRMVNAVRRLAALAALVAAAAPWSVCAQTGNPPSHVQEISMNPVTTAVGMLNVEYERQMTPGATWGVSGSTLSFADASYKNVNALARYYPRTALSGFYIGGSAGVYHVSVESAAGTFFGAGPEIGYSWLLGKRENVALSLGLGATRLFGGNLSGVSFTIPNVRLLNVGVAF